MKKTLVALAALAAASAFAQSTATLYGRIDLGYNQSSTTTTTQNPVGIITTGKTKVSELAGGENRRTTSRIGLRGSEDLGGGLKANFNWEARMGGNGQSLDDATSGLGRIRQANISVTGGFGGVILGTYDNSMDRVRGYSVTGNGAGGNIVDDVALIGSKSNNAIGYFSPNFGGFTFGFGTVGQKANAINNAGVETTLAKINGTMFGLGYSNGPLAVNAAYAQAKQAVKAPAGAVLGIVAGAPAVVAVPALDVSGKAKEFAIAASYDLGMAKPYFVYQNGTQNGNVANGIAIAGSEKRTSYNFGASFPMGNLTPFIEIGRTSWKDTVGLAPGVSANDKIRAYQLGVLYSLSKRTTVYAQTGSERATSTVSNVAGYAKSKTTDFNFGVRHDF